MQLFLATCKLATLDHRSSEIFFLQNVVYQHLNPVVFSDIRTVSQSFYTMFNCCEKEKIMITYVLMFVKIQIIVHVQFKSPLPFTIPYFLQLYAKISL